MESIFSLLFERTTDAVWLVDPATATVTDCNQAAVELMRCAGRGDLSGKRLGDISVGVQPDALPARESLANHLAEIHIKGNARFEWVVRPG